jgi:hypothetical protein
MTGSGILTDILLLNDKNSQDTGYRALALVWLDLVLKDIQNKQQSSHWKFLEVKGTVFDLTADDFDYALATILSTTLIDTTKIIHVYDKFNDRTYHFVPYERFREMVADEYEDGGDPYVFSIFAGQLLLWPVPDFTAITGTPDAIVANKLSDSTATFITDGVRSGMRVTNTVANTTAMITSVDSETVLTLDTNIFTALNAYSIKEAAYIDYVKMMSNATDNTTVLDVPDKYKKVLYDGIQVYAYAHDPELGDTNKKSLDYKMGLDDMVSDNSPSIAENVRPISHREKSSFPSGAHVGEFPLARDNM